MIIHSLSGNDRGHLCQVEVVTLQEGGNPSPCPVPSCLLIMWNEKSEKVKLQQWFLLVTNLFNIWLFVMFLVYHYQVKSLCFNWAEVSQEQMRGSQVMCLVIEWTFHIVNMWICDSFIIKGEEAKTRPPETLTNTDFKILYSFFFYNSRLFFK